MKRITASRSRVVALLVLGVLELVGVATVTASAGTRRSAAPPTPTCSLASVAGTWGHNYDGWTSNGGMAPFSGVGRTTIDSQGNVSGTDTGNLSFSNPAAPLTITGTLSVNADCTGTLTINTQSNFTKATAIWAVVFVNNETEVRGALQQLLFNNFNVQNISGTINGNKLFPPTSTSGS